MLKFSIVTVTLNSEATIGKTINSINNQKFKNFEYIVVDGKSVDNTLHEIKKLRHNDVKIISEEDRGIFDAMNKGIKLSKGDFIAFLNSDDWYENDALYLVNNYLEKYPNTDVFYTDAKFFKKKKFKFYSKSKFHKLNYDMSISHPGMFVKKKILQNFLFDLKYQISADYDFVLKVKNLYRFSYLQKSIVNISLGGRSSDLLLSSKEFFEIQKKYFGFKKANINFIKKYHYHILKIIFLKLINRIKSI